MKSSRCHPQRFRFHYPENGSDDDDNNNKKIKNRNNRAMSTRLIPVGSYRLGRGVSLIIVQGSVLDFEPQNTQDAAIVNAANTGCLGGGGVDGAISNAGGDALYKARLALPILRDGHYNIRCKTGDAKLSGPGKFGQIKTNHVIHAVAPDYNYFDVSEYGKADNLLRSAYWRTLDVAESAKLEEVGFSLLAAGVFRGRRSLKEILVLGIESICGWFESHAGKTTIQSVFLCAFLENEANTLLDIAHDLGLEKNF